MGHAVRNSVPLLLRGVDLESLRKILYDSPGSLAHKLDTKSLLLEQTVSETSAEVTSLGSRIDSGFGAVMNKLEQSCDVASAEVIRRLDGHDTTAANECVAEVSGLRIELAGQTSGPGPKEEKCEGVGEEFLQTAIDQLRSDMEDLLDSGLEQVQAHTTAQFLKLRTTIFSEFDLNKAGRKESLGGITNAIAENVTAQVGEIADRLREDVYRQIGVARDRLVARIDGKSGAVEGKLLEVSSKVGAEAEGTILKFESVVDSQRAKVEEKIESSRHTLFKDIKAVIEQDSNKRHGETRKFQADDLQTFANIILDNFDIQTRTILGSKKVAESDISVADVCSMVSRAGGCLPWFLIVHSVPVLFCLFLHVVCVCVLSRFNSLLKFPSFFLSFACTLSRGRQLPHGPGPCVRPAASDLGGRLRGLLLLC